MKYKVGDRVRIKSIDWYNENKDEYGNIDISYDFTFYADRSKYCGKVFTISEVFDNSYFVKEDNKEYYWSDEMIEGPVEELLDKEMEEYQRMCDEIMAIQGIEPIEAEIEEVWHCPKGYIFKDENGNVINATKIVLEKKKKEYPKTFLECCDVLNIGNLIERGVKGYKSELLDTFQKLLICRDAYWKIAGEEMGLGKPWEPDWCDYTTKYCIPYSPQYKGFLKRQYDGIKHILAFPTAEMRDAFYENFKELIEKCKELL